MKIIKFNSFVNDLPFNVSLSLNALYERLEGFVDNPAHPYHRSAKVLLEKAIQFPELREGIEGYNQLEKHADIIEMLTESLFPEPLQSNEIKAIMVPFQNTAFRLTDRFSSILKNAGKDYEVELVGYDEENMFMMACSFILGKYYQTALKTSRPLFAAIPNAQTGITHHYRVLLNADFMEIEKAADTPELTEEDINELIRNGNNLELWKSKFPPGSYSFKGFGIMNLYDATLDLSISSIRSLFLRKDNNVFSEFQDNLRTLFGIKDLELGYSVYNPQTENVVNTMLNDEAKSLFLNPKDLGKYAGMFCEGVCQMVMHQKKIIAIPDIENYGKGTGYNLLSKRLLDRGFNSFMFAPIFLDNGLVKVIELASPRKNELNSLNAPLLQDIIPFVKLASERYYEEAENQLESTIQENYTTIHPTVKWRFNKAAAHFNKQKAAGVEMPQLDEIRFEGIYPIYGQSDIKGSSTARNEAIKADLEMQLKWVIETFDKVMDIKPLPIYKKLIFRVNQCLKKVEGGLKAGDELSILGFLKTEIYPVFNHLKSLGPDYQQMVEEYISHIDPTLNVVYKKRKDYDDSVTILNERLSAVLDRRQDEAQEMYPHYFQRYNTDGVEYNIYIGGSLLENQQFDKMYLHNMRLWQLETMWDIEQKARDLYHKLPYPLEVASLILVHSNPLAIKFQMDAKQFDVDGAYNARYEIVKKRIDKSYIKGTNERLTQPGKIAIVYSQMRMHGNI